MVMSGRCGMKMREEAAGLRSTPLCTGHSPDRIRKSEDLPHLVTRYIDNRYLDLLLWPPVRSGDEDVLPGPDGQAEAGHHLVIDIDIDTDCRYRL